MKNRFGKALFFCLPALFFIGVQCLSTERIFILKNEEQIIQYRVRDSQNEITRVASYSKEDFPGMFPAYSIEMNRGNILSIFGQGRKVKGRVVYDPNSDQLKIYESGPGDRTSLSGRLLENPDLNEPFRQKSHLYLKNWANPTRHKPLAKKFGAEYIIRGGENIACLEIEAAIYEHPSVLEASVFGVPDERLGEKLATRITTNPEMQLTEEELSSFLEEKIAKFKIPEFVWIQKEKLPRIASGKIAKKEMRENAIKDLHLG